ncbi:MULTISPECIES: hypothetical protein [Rheinheimera]|uniref:Uncharacterized protein n=1 Tax=Rheinheimera marina TaxID=1774958 RepID=A0ABV9JMF0_9GAMM
MTELTSTSLTFNQPAEFRQATSRLTPTQQASNTLVRQVQLQNTTPTLPGPVEQIAETDVVRVSSTIGKAASSGRLSREEALDIYREIASLL